MSKTHRENWFVLQMILVQHAEKLVIIGVQWIASIFFIFHDRNENKDSLQRAKRDGYFYLHEIIFCLTPTPLKNYFSAATKTWHFSVFADEKSENLVILEKIF